MSVLQETTSTVGLSLRDVEDLVHVRLRHQLGHLAGQAGQQDRVAGHQSQTRNLHFAETKLPHLKCFLLLHKEIHKNLKCRSGKLAGTGSRSWLSRPDEGLQLTKVVIKRFTFCHSNWKIKALWLGCQGERGRMQNIRLQLVVV